LVAFVGAGGKSTLMLAFGRGLAAARKPVVVTTTTRMGSDQIPDWARVCRTVDEVRETLDAGSPAFLLRAVTKAKVIGVGPELVDAVFAATGATTLVEADGANRRSFKAPGSGEPVIPHATTTVVIVAGADAVGGRIGDVCHRPERVAAITDRAVTDVLRPRDMARVLGHPDGGLKGAPPHARICVMLTNLDRADPAVVDEVGAVLDERMELFLVT
jgi:probable selenium-dependent hydroxylase accessory protein YqeC